MFFPLSSRYPALTLGTTAAPYMRPNVLGVGEIEGLELKVYVTGTNECVCCKRNRGWRIQGQMRLEDTRG